MTAGQYTRMSVCTWLCLALLQHAASAVNTRLFEVFSWNTLLIRENGTEELEPGQFVPANNMPASIELWTDRMFFAVPRYNPGVLATLVFFKMNSSASNVTQSPELSPYPNLEINNITDLKAWPPQLLSVVSMRADACERLWVLDVGTVESKQLSPPKLVLFDLKTDHLLFTFPLKDKVNFNEKSFFPSLAVDVTSSNCDNAFVYLPDALNYNLIVFSLFSNDTHVITHNYFHFDPLSGHFSQRQSQSGLYGLSLSPMDREGFRTVFFHALASTMEFAVNSKYLQNTSLASEQMRAFKVVGDRGTGGQSFSSFLDEETGVLFHTLYNTHAVGCWNSFKGDEYEVRSLGLVADEIMNSSYPVDLRVDKKGHLWVLVAPLLHLLQDHTLNISDTNIWVFKAPVRQAIKNTVCDEM